MFACTLVHIYGVKEQDLIAAARFVLNNGFFCAPNRTCAYTFVCAKQISTVTSKIPHTGLGNLYFFGCTHTRKGLAGTSKVAYQKFAKMETTEFFANDTKGNVAGCPAPKPTAPLFVTALTGDHRRIIITTKRQWQNIGSNFPSYDPLHLCGQRHGMGCAPLRSGPHIPMELL